VMADEIKVERRRDMAKVTDHNYGKIHRDGNFHFTLHHHKRTHVNFLF
jgi:hypothetical protein